ncbi:hypothetical protein JQ628_10265 [Bradyrhizobium lablabi]|uniref:hypothetical protein n=1 Tax=Bradyrhizobium lablabi TaxID=722472 RepID=UPI001BA80FC3|nr:hypothetical protein [Bradyrhizobium lablabi]MBR1121895.1 hypothetical protein [Bradyrhizobium lablabi]
MARFFWTLFNVGLATIQLWWKKLVALANYVGVAKLPTDLGEIFGTFSVSIPTLALVGVGLVGLYLTNRDFWHAILERKTLERSLSISTIVMVLCGLGFVAALAYKIWGESSASTKLTWVFSGMGGKSDENGFRVGDIQFTSRNTTGRSIRLLDAYIESGIDGGKKRPLYLNSREHGLISVFQANQIPAGTEMTLISKFPDLSERDFMKDWGVIHFLVQDDAETFRGRIESKQLSEAFAGHHPKPAAPQVTKAPESATLPKRAYTPADVRVLPEALLEIANVLNTKALAVKNDNFSLANDCRTIIKALGRTNAVERLQKTLGIAADVGKELYAIKDRHGYYIREINYIVEASDEPSAFVSSGKIFIDAMLKLPEHPTEDVLSFINPPLNEFIGSVNRFREWHENSNKRLLEIKGEIAAASARQQ